MGHEIFRPEEGIIRVDLTVTGIKRDSFRTIVAALDTGGCNYINPVKRCFGFGI